MLIQLTASDLIYVFSIFMACTISCILLYQNKANYTRWLAFSYLALAMVFFITFLYATKWILFLPHLYRTGPVFLFLYMLFSFFYVKASITHRKPRTIEWLHIVPIVLYVVDSGALLFSPGTNKLFFLEKDVTGSIPVFSHGWLLPAGFLKYYIATVPLVYWLIQVSIFIFHHKRRGVFFDRQNDYWVKWIIFYLSFQFMVLLPVYLISVLGDAGSLMPIAHVFASVFIIQVILSLFIHPDSRRNPPGFIEKASVASIKTSLPADAPVKNITPAPGPLRNLSHKQIEIMKSEVETFLKYEKPFLQHGYSLQQMAGSLSYPLHQLSALINQEYKLNFNDFINKYRIDYALAVIREKKFMHLNINGLADQCGFNNRNSFTVAFKKFTGQTPSDFFKSQV